MAQKSVPPMVPGGAPGAPDLSQPTADEIARDEVARREAQDAEHGRYARDEKPFADDREASIDMARGGDRVYSNDDWSRSMGPTDIERRRKIREIMSATLLPQLPVKVGVHRFWASTTHRSDTPRRREALGYRYIKYEELASEGWDVDQFAVKDASNPFNGYVMWREHIAMEIEMDDWTAIMRELHHDQPMDQSRAIYETLDAAGEQARKHGGKTTMAPGMDELTRFTRPPRQFEG